MSAGAAGPMSKVQGPRSSLRNRIIAAIWVVAKGAGFDSGRVHEIGSKEIGRILVDDFGMTTCDSRELGRWLEAVKRSADLPVHSYTRTGEHPRRPRRAPKDPPQPARAQRLAGNVIRVASVEQFQFARALEAELHIGMEEAAGIAARACGSRVPRTAVQVSKYTEALKAIRARRLRAARPASEHASRLGGSSV